MKRTLSLVLVLAMLFSAMLGVMSFAEAEEPAATLEVTQANLEFSNAVYLYIAVDYSAVGSADGITLKITNSKTGKSTVLSPATSVSAPSNCVAFKYIDLGSKNMGDELSIQALKDGKPSGEAKTYSVLEYALKAKGKGDAKLTKLMNAMLQYGADAQTAFDYEGTYDLDKEWGLIVVNGSNEGKVLAEAGTSATFTPNTAKTGANAALYDMSLNKVEGEFVVPAVSYKYYYIGDAQKTTHVLDMTKTDSSVNGSFDGAAAKLTKNFYFSDTVAGDYSAPKGTNGINFHQFSGVLYDSATSKYSGVAKMDVVGGENGYIKTYAVGKQSLAIQGSAGTDALIRNMEGGVFTLAMTIGKDGVEKMIDTVLRFRGDSSTNSANFLIIQNDGENSIIKGVDNASTYRSFATIEGKAGEKNYITFYVVIDVNANTYTYYNNLNDTVLKVSAPTAAKKTLKDVFGYNLGKNNGAFIDWTASGCTDKHVLVQKMYIFEGNIFE